MAESQRMVSGKQGGKIVCMPTQCYDIPRRFFGIMYVELDGLRSRKWNSERVVGSVSVSYIATYPMC